MLAFVFCLLSEAQEVVRTLSRSCRSVLQSVWFACNVVVASSLRAMSGATVLLFNKIQRTAWEVEFGPRKLAGQCS